MAYDPNHNRGKIKGEWRPVDYYFKPPYTMEYIIRLSVDAWSERYFREVLSPTRNYFDKFTEEDED